MVYTEFAEPMRTLDMEQRGVLLTAVMAYAAGEDVPDMEPVTQMLFTMMRQRMDRDAEKYAAACRKNAENVRKRWDARANDRMPTDTTVYDRMPNDTSVYERIRTDTKAYEPIRTDTNDTDNDNDSDSDKDIKEKINKKKSARFVAPTVEEVRAYCLERGNNVDPETFVDFYAGKGWMVGKNRMKDWRACVRTWEKDRRQPQKAKANWDIDKRTYDFSVLEGRLIGT